MARTLALLIVVVGVLGLVATAAAQDGGGQGVALTARAGFDGYYKSDFWVPVRVDAANEGQAIQGHLQVAAGSSSDEILYRSPISLPRSSRKGQTLYVHMPNLSTTLTVELVSDSGDVVAVAESNRLSALADDALLYGVITREPGRLEYLEDVTGGRSEAAVAYLVLDELPEVAAGLNALDVIIFHHEDSGKLTAEQRQALAGWIDTGGHLVVTGGPAWQESAAGLSDMLPVNITGTRSLGDIPALRNLAKLAFRDPGPYLIAEAALRNGQSLIHQDGMPLLARRAQGRGSVYFLAPDPSLAPLLDWEGSKAVWSEMVRYIQPLPDWAKGARNSYAANSAVSSLPASDLPAAWALFLFLMIYVVVVGPLNYWILRRLGRRELAWLSIPGLVLLFSVTAYLVGFRLKGDETIINQMSIVYGQVDGDHARVQTLIGLYSPRRTTYDMTLPSQAIPRPFERSFSMLSGPGNIEAIERGGTVTISDIRVDVAGIETFVADSYQPLPALSGSVRLRPGGGTVVMDIALHNNSQVGLENATLLVGALAIPLGDLAPGASLSHAEPIAAPAASSSTIGPFGGYMPSAPGMSPITTNMDTILGSSAYYNDREVYPRWQLLQALAPDYVASTSSYSPDTVTLVTWSDQPQLALDLSDADHGTSATTLYFLELPLQQEFAGGQEMVLPRPLLSWTVLNEAGVYNAQIEDLFLNQGSIEFEYQPWPDFQTMAVRDLIMVMQAPGGLSAQRLPQVQLWDWAAESWRTADDPAWGRFAIEDPLRYVGPGNAVRVRLMNPGPDSLNIQLIYPELTGVVE